MDFTLTPDEQAKADDLDGRIPGRAGYFGRDGQPISFGTWAMLKERSSGGQDDPCRVAETTVGESWVSTVWMGLDHSFGHGPPLIFETLVFGGPLDDEMDRYSTEAQAIAGHDQMVAKVREAGVSSTTATGETDG